MMEELRKRYLQEGSRKRPLTIEEEEDNLLKPVLKHYVKDKPSPYEVVVLEGGGKRPLTIEESLPALKRPCLDKKKEETQNTATPPNKEDTSPPPSPEWIMGIDPAEVSLGVCWLHPTKKLCHLRVIDLHVANGIMYDIQQEQWTEIVNMQVKSWRKWMMCTKSVFIESQVVPDGPRDVLIITIALEQSIRFMYPHLKVHMVNPRTMKHKMGIPSANSDYSLSKRYNLARFSDFVSVSEMKSLTKYFRRDGKQKFDAFDAALYAMYGHLFGPVASRIKQIGPAKEDSNLQTDTRLVRLDHKYSSSCVESLKGLLLGDDDDETEGKVAVVAIKGVGGVDSSR
jgi:hypothetical protein